MTADPDRIPETALAWARAGKGAALATVVETWGSAPRPKGAQLAIAGDGEMVGSVSGGCVEGAVVAEALEALGDGGRGCCEYGVSDEDAFAVGLACGGTIRVMVEPVGVGQGPDAALLARLVAARAAREAGGLRGAPGRTGSGGWSPGRGDPLWEPARGGARRRPLRLRRRLVSRRAQPAAAHGGGRRGAHRPGAGADGAARRLRRDRRRPARGLRQRRALSRHAAHPRLAGRGARRLRARRAHRGGHADPRPQARRPGDRGGARARRSSTSAASARPAPTPAGSSGCAAAGFAEAEIARIHAPIGADIGAQSPAEIAVAILAADHRAAAPPRDPAAEMRFGPVPRRRGRGRGARAFAGRRRAAAEEGPRCSARPTLAALAAAGIAEVTVARLEPGDLAEDAAAEAVARALAPDPAALGLAVSAPFTGRVNLFAEAAGLLRVDRAAVDALNRGRSRRSRSRRCPTGRASPPRQMVATVKIIPYGVAGAAAARAPRPPAPALLGLHPFRPGTASLILTRTPGLKESLIAKGAEAVGGAARGARPGAWRPPVTVAHEIGGGGGGGAARPTGDMVLILGGSATSDAADTAPSGLVAAGGRLIRFGMPVDPGNLLFLGEHRRPAGGRAAGLRPLAGAERRRLGARAAGGGLRRSAPTTSPAWGSAGS